MKTVGANCVRPYTGNTFIKRSFVMEVYIIIPIAVVLIIIIWWISTGNRFQRLVVKIDESESGIDVALVKRYDMLTKMMEVCKQYALHERDTFSKIIELRRGMSMRQRSEASSQMDDLTGRLNVIAESYPELRSSDQYGELQRGIRDAEEHLQAARRLHNSNVSIYNQLLATFPNSVVGRSLKMVRREFFEAEQLKKQDVDMSKLSYPIGKT